MTNGFGNNLFQYNAARLLAEFLEQDMLAIPPSESYYAIPFLEEIGVVFGSMEKSVSDYRQVNDKNYKSFFNTGYKESDLLLSGYFEDYTNFKSEINRISSWYPSVQKRKDEDLVIHFRGGDRLLYKNEFDSKPSAERYVSAVKKFNFSNVHIVTDMPKWDYITEDDLVSMRFHVATSPSIHVSPDKSVEYFNSIVESLSVFEPSVEKRTILGDFNFIRTFNNILFQHGTLGWWAAALSSAKNVGVYGPWRQWKGDSNTNLSDVNFKGWFKWE
jgi:hypothetical protein